MASGGDVTDELVATFKEFCTLAGSKDPSQMTSKANGKMVSDCLMKDFKSYDIKAICDASVFPACKTKGVQHMVVNKESVDKYVTKTALEVAKKKHKDPKMKETDERVGPVKKQICECIAQGAPNVKTVKQSKTGGVDKMTDASQYTGSHKERFDKDGKGKGKDGRVEKVNTSGYVDGYKMEGTHGSKTKK